MLTVVISQAQGRNPTRRQLEEDIASGLLHEAGVSVTLVPHLYDMPQNHSGLQFLREVPGDIVVFSWLYERAIRWTLDRAGVRGKVAQTLLQAEDETDEDEDFDNPDENSDRSPAAGIGSVEVPSRNIWCIDLRVPKSAAECLTEIQRIRGQQADRPAAATSAMALAGTASDEAGLMAWIRGIPQPTNCSVTCNPNGSCRPAAPLIAAPPRWKTKPSSRKTPAAAGIP